MKMDRLVGDANLPSGVEMLPGSILYLETDGNVTGLGLAWFADLPTNRGIETTPLMADGVLYVTAAWGHVLAYDARRGTELTRTLGVYISAGCSTRRTAELMCIHHRTVSYRLKRVCDLAGFSLDDQEDLFRIQLACKILALSAPGTPGTPGTPTGPGRG